MDCLDDRTCCAVNCSKMMAAFTGLLGRGRISCLVCDALSRHGKGPTAAGRRMYMASLLQQPGMRDAESLPFWNGGGGGGERGVTAPN